MGHGGWTEERVAEMKALIGEGLSCAQIARSRGGGLSRSAVIDKIHRLHLSKPMPARRDNGVRCRVAGTRSARPVKRWAAAFDPDEMAPAPRLNAEGARISLIALAPEDCKWPIGEVGSADFHFCANARTDPKNPRTPYCPFHMRAQQPREQRGKHP